MTGGIRTRSIMTSLPIWSSLRCAEAAYYLKQGGLKMGKPKSQPVPGATDEQHASNRGEGQQEPLSGSKKVKQANHTRHNNAEG